MKVKLPTNKKVITFGKKPSNYFCCSNRQGLDTIEHILNNWQFVAYVWKSLAAVAGITPNHTSLQHVLIQLWITKHKNEAHKLLLQVTAIFIWRNLWMNWFPSKYGRKSSNISRVKYAIYMDTYKLLKVKLPQIRGPSTWNCLIY